jgi:hypothetical protein
LRTEVEDIWNQLSAESNNRAAGGSLK